MCAGFLAANPYALLDHQAFRDGLEKQTETAGEDGGKLGLANTSGWRYYLSTFTWGLGWLPSLFALGGAVGLLARHRRLGLLLAPAPVLLVLYLGNQSRFFARWLLPIYPILCLLAAWGVIAAATWLARRFEWRVAIPALALSVARARCRASSSASTTTSCWPRPTRAWWRATGWWQNIPSGAKIVVEPIAPDQWAMDPGHPIFEAQGGTGSGNRWNKWRTSRSCFFNGKTIKSGAVPGGQDRGLRAHHAARAREVLRGRRLLLGRHRLDAVRPRLRGPEGRPVRDPATTTSSSAAAKSSSAPARTGRTRERVPFSFDDSFNYAPLKYERPGPEIVIYRLHGEQCA